MTFSGITSARSTTTGSPVRALEQGLAGQYMTVDAPLSELELRLPRQLPTGDIVEGLVGSSTTPRLEPGKKKGKDSLDVLEAGDFPIHQILVWPLTSFDPCNADTYNIMECLDGIEVCHAESYGSRSPAGADTTEANRAFTLEQASGPGNVFTVHTCTLPDRLTVIL